MAGKLSSTTPGHPHGKETMMNRTDLISGTAPATGTLDSTHALQADAACAADAAHVLDLIGGYQISQAVYTAAALKLPDLIATGVDTSESLAARTGTVPDRVHRLLRTLAASRLFAQTGSRSWGLTSAGQTLRSDVPGSLHALALTWNEEHYDAFRAPIDAVRSPRPAFDHRFGTDWWRYLSEHPESAGKFHAAMGNIGKQVHAAALQAADLAPASWSTSAAGQEA